MKSPARNCAIATRALWRRLLAWPFRIKRLGFNARIHRTCKVEGGPCIAIGARTVIHARAWLTVPVCAGSLSHHEPIIVIGSGCSIGQDCGISAIYRVTVGKDVLMGPRVWITDHNHEYRDVSLAVMAQGVTRGGWVVIEDNVWIATGAVIIGARGLRIGIGSVVGANAVVTADVPPHSMVVGNPARVVKRYDPAFHQWVGTTTGGTTARPHVQ